MVKIQNIIKADYSFLAVNTGDILEGIVRLNSKHKFKGYIYSEIRCISVPITITDKVNYDENSLFFYGNSTNLNYNCRRWKKITEFQDYLDEEFLKGITLTERIEKGRYKIPLELLNLSDKRTNLIEQNLEMLKNTYSDISLDKMIISYNKIKNLGTRLIGFPSELRKEIIRNKEYYFFYGKDVTVRLPNFS